MENRYLKIEPEQANYIKRQLSLYEESLSNISRIIRAYKLLRKKEIVIKNKLKLSISSLKAKMSLMESTFPEDERKIHTDESWRNEHRADIRPVQRTQVQESRNINQELEEIRQKLARFQT